MNKNAPAVNNYMILVDGFRFQISVGTKPGGGTTQTVRSIYSEAV